MRTSIVQHGISGGFALREGDWKYIPANADKGPSDMGSGANPHDTRFAAASITEPQLFNLRTDPSETNSLAKQLPRKAAAFQKSFDTIRGATLNLEP